MKLSTVNQPNEIKGNLEFSNVVFAYPSRPKQRVCRHLSFTVGAGTSAALVGRSGCGKSTCIQLLQRFYDPIEGTVTLDGINLIELNITWLRSKIALVGQEPVLFNGTIDMNILFGNPNATKEEIQSAAVQAHAHHFISKLDKQYDTDVGERGGKLSGGQKQRVAIALALVRNPHILLLDEATSALDNESEMEVQQALDKLMETCNFTTVMIAHRLSTIRDANEILLFEKGRVVEQGTYDELMSKQGKFVALQATQAQ